MIQLSKYLRNKPLTFDQEENHDMLLENFIGITVLFSLLYIIIDDIIGFDEGVYMILINSGLLTLILALYIKNVFPYRLSANLSIATSFILVVCVTTFYSGGLFSPVL